jgi:predicted Zn-dependent protease
MFGRAIEVAGGTALRKLDPHVREKLLGVLGAGGRLYTLSFDREQESEADHIGIFLMTFARYDPDQAVTFWQKMEELSEKRPHPPAILSTHPSDAQRIRLIQKWIPYAKQALEAYDSGHVIND